MAECNEANTRRELGARVESGDDIDSGGGQCAGDGAGDMDVHVE